MREILSKYPRATKLVLLAGIVLLVAVFVVRLANYTPPNGINKARAAFASLESLVTAANEASGIQSGAAFDYALVSIGNPSNFAVVRCRDEVRCDRVVKHQIAKFEQANTPAADTAEVDLESSTVTSLHRAVPAFANGEYPKEQIEQTVRDFLMRVYPQFPAMESLLTFDPSMKGVRFNNSNYFFRWNDNNYTLPEGVSIEVQPYIQVSITSGGFIFGYDNTIVLKENLKADSIAGGQ